jgi:hypothetical protein
VRLMFCMFSVPSLTIIISGNLSIIYYLQAWHKMFLTWRRGQNMDRQTARFVLVTKYSPWIIYGIWQHFGSALTLYGSGSRPLSKCESGVSSNFENECGSVRIRIPVKRFLKKLFQRKFQLWLSMKIKCHLHIVIPSVPFLFWILFIN